MALNNTQISLADVDDKYRVFVEKFKPKKTTDDCYTPPNVYEAVLDWVVAEYGIDRENIVRPFWPGGDYERAEYPEGCTVVDNPPFSMVSNICRVYQGAGVKFFLFAPYLTNFSSQVRGLTHIITDIDVMYENGATVNTAFLTNLQPGCEMRTAPTLRKAIYEADRANRKEGRKELPKYSYPPEVITATAMGYLSKYGQDFSVATEDCFFIRGLESQRPLGKAIFGAGYLLSERAAAERAAAERAAAERAAAERAAATRWQLSDRERAIIASLGKEKQQ